MHVGEKETHTSSEEYRAPTREVPSSGTSSGDSDARNNGLPQGVSDSNSFDLPGVPPHARKKVVAQIVALFTTLDSCLLCVWIQTGTTCTGTKVFNMHHVQRNLKVFEHALCGQ